MKASDINAKTNAAFLFKGPIGFGKTIAAASFALEGPVHLAYWDKKSPIELKTFFTKARFGDKAKTIINNIDYDVYDSSNAVDYLNQILQWKDKGCRYTALINDSLTYMTSAVVNWSLNFGHRSKAIEKLKDIIPDFGEYKAETSLITQCIDNCRNLPCHVIWTAHPLPTTKIEGSGSNMQVSKTNSLVSYGSKVAGQVPGGFTEIYHFTQKSNWSDGKTTKQYVASLSSIGDEFAKSPLMDGSGISELDFTNKLFYEVWKEAVEKAFSIRADEPSTEDKDEGIVNPFNSKPSESKWKSV